MTTAIENMPRVTVFMPAFNAERYIGQAIESVLDQSFADFDFVIIDDASIDDTYRVIQRYEYDPRLRVLRHSTNRGAPSTRNEGLKLISGEYVALMDADDVSAPERLQRQVEYLDAHPDIDVIATRWTLVDEHARPISTKGRPRQLYTPDEIAARMLFACPIHHPTVMARSAVLRRFQYDSSFPASQDHELWSRMVQNHRFAVLPERLMLYRQHEGQTTAGTQRMHAARRRVQSRQLEALGLVFDAEDVIKHDQLFRLKGRRLFKQQMGYELDLDFLRWAARWMELLLRSNMATRRYPEHEFSRIIGACWWRLCTKAAGGPSGPVAVWTEFARAPLKRVVGRAFLPTGQAQRETDD